MLNAIVERIRQKRRTVRYPAPGFETPVLPPRFRGRPTIDRAACAASAGACSAACMDTCPTGALSMGPDGPVLDMGRCLFCTDCVRACPAEALAFSGDHRLSARRREDLVTDGQTLKLAEALDDRTRRLFGRSLKLRQVSAGGCNGCEADLNVLSTVVFDLGRFGIEFVASPRHADGLVVTGPVTRNMQLALMKCWEATPEPRLLIAVGACAISGGPFIGLPESTDGAGTSLSVDLFIPGCPPHPYTSLDGILRLLGKL